MKFWQTVPFAAALAVLQAQSPSVTPIPSPSATEPVQLGAAPLYRVLIVQGSAKAINYRNLKSSTEVELKGTVLAPSAKGEAKIKSEKGVIHITAKVKELPLASAFGPEYLTYVLWGISPEGRTTNLGELVLKHGKGKGKVEVIEPIQTFGLVVTAEPYFAVSKPSDVVVMENAIGKDTQNTVETIDAHYELLKRGQYTVNLTVGSAITMDDKTPFDLYQARNAVRIAQASGGAAYASEPMSKAVGYLQAAETLGGDKKEKIMNSREAVQRAEDARLIAVQRQETERVATEAKWEQLRLDEAKRQAALAAAATDHANQQLLVANEQTQAVASENETLKTRLMSQLSAVLATRATARGLIVNMNGMLFQSGKAMLQPAARDKLAKIAGILSAHKGLKIEADGFTDSQGGETFNQHLSEQRAQASKDYLVSQGVASDAVTFKGFGKENPIASNATNAGRQENRRVELVVSGAGVTSAQM